MPRTKRRPEVVLIHGLARGPASMRGLADALTSAGFEPRLYGYASTKEWLERQGADLVRQLTLVPAV